MSSTEDRAVDAAIAAAAAAAAADMQTGEAPAPSDDADVERDAPAPRRRRSGWDEGPPAGSTALVLASASSGAAIRGEPALTMQVNQQWVGFLIGPGGATLNLVRDKSGASIQIDQETKTQGFSIAKFYGTPEAAAEAQRLVMAKLAEVDPALNTTGQPSGGASTEVQVEQSLVGYLLGKGGETLKGIRTLSGANLVVDQTTKDLGFSVVRIIGSEQAISVAKDLVLNKVGEIKLPENFTSTNGFEYRVDQSKVGWLIGKNGAMVKQIKAVSGATVIIDQSTKEQGFSTVRILPGVGMEAAKQMIETKLKEAREAGLQNAADAAGEDLLVPQHLVGWLIGRNGDTLKAMREQSGATIVLNQNTKDQGYSVIRFAGPHEAIVRARGLIEAKMHEAENRSQAGVAPPGVGPPALPSPPVPPEGEPSLAPSTVLSAAASLIAAVTPGVSPSQITAVTPSASMSQPSQAQPTAPSLEEQLKILSAALQQPAAQSGGSTSIPGGQSLPRGPPRPPEVPRPIGAPSPAVLGGTDVLPAAGSVTPGPGLPGASSVPQRPSLPPRGLSGDPPPRLMASPLPPYRPPVQVAAASGISPPVSLPGAAVVPGRPVGLNALAGVSPLGATARGPVPRAWVPGLAPAAEDPDPIWGVAP